MTHWDWFFVFMYWFGMWGIGLLLGFWMERRNPRPDGGTHHENWYAPGPFSDDSGGGVKHPVDANF